MRVAITGSNGLVGQKLVYLLKQCTDLELIATGRGENRLLNKEGYRYCPVNLNSKESLVKFFETYKPDVLINPAAITQVDYCELNKEECAQINTEAVQWMADLCRKLDAHFIHFSTDFVFDGAAGPYKEEDKASPISFYGQTKVKSEDIVLKANLKHWNIVRTVLVYGLTDNMSRSNFVLWIKKSLENGENIKVVNDQVRTPTLAEDIALACKELIYAKKNGVFHISGNETVSIIEFAYKVADFFKLNKKFIAPISSGELNQPAKRPPVTGFYTNKAASDLNFKPSSLDQGLLHLSNQLKSGSYN